MSSQSIDVIADAPQFVRDGLIFLAQGGSRAYGTFIEGQSDVDLYGVTIPPPKILNPYEGKFYGFDEVTPFTHWKVNEDGLDRTVYNVTRFCKLASDCNPNILEMLFYPDDCIIYQNASWKCILRNRIHFLSKEIHQRFTGMAYASIKRLKSNKSTSSKRIALHEKFGFDTKDAAQTARILLFCKDLLLHGTINMRIYSDKICRIKEGYYDYNYVMEYSADLIHACDVAVQKSSLPPTTDKKQIREILKESIMFSKWGLPHDY